MIKILRIHGKLEKMNGDLMVKTTYYQLLSVMLDIQWVWKNEELTNFGKKTVLLYRR